MNQTGGDAVFKIPNPKLYPEPSKVRYEELVRGVDDVRRSFVLKNLKASWRAVLGLSALALIGASYGVRQANNHIHGSSRTGGSFLAVSTRNTDEDLEYNREFQRMKYLSVPGTTGQSTTDGYVLADLGLKETNLPAGEFRKRAPHYKYY